MSKIIDDTKKHDYEMKICITELFISFDNFFLNLSYSLNGLIKSGCMLKYVLIPKIMKINLE